MLKYLESCQTGLSDNPKGVNKVNYYYETYTGIMYMQCEYEGNFMHTDPIMPVLNRNGSYLTYSEFLIIRGNKLELK